MSETEAWDQHASWWQANFADGADPEYVEQILPLLARELDGTGQVLDVGTGEGQVARLAAAGDGGRQVVGIDLTWAQISEAQRRQGGPAYVRSQASALPFTDARFDAVIACLVFEHVVDAGAAIAEVSRVLRAGGRFLFVLNHPLLQTPGSGWVDDRILDEQYWRIGPYLSEDSSIEEVDKGVFLPFVHRPLHRYVNALAAAGLLVVCMQEPPPPPGFLQQAGQYPDADKIPRMLFLRAEKLLRSR